jgi:hypothetical protein
MNPLVHTINPIIPYRGTAARKWFEENNAKLYDELEVTTSKKEPFECDEPLVETEDFSKEDRKKAYYMFLFRTIHPSLKISKIPKIFLIAKTHNLYPEFFFWLPRGILESLFQKKNSFNIALQIYKNEGLIELARRYRFRNRI